MHNGSVDFDKELAHNEHSARAEKKGVFGNSLPFNQWIGGKFRIYNLPNGHVKLEAYADFGDGVWKLVNETVDDGTWAADSGGCSQWDSDRDIYTGAGVVFIRNTDVDRAEYRDFSVRELGAVDKEPTPSEPVGIPLRINAGGGQVEDGNGDIWRADQAYGPGNAWGYAASSGGAANHNLNVSGTDEDAIYSTERWGMDAYRVDVENGEYDVRLLFAETYDGITGATQRVFDVTVEGNEVSPALDAYAEAGFGTALVKDVQGVVVNDGRLDIVFDGQVENPMIKGVAVLPEGTLSGATPTPTPPPTTTPTPTPPEPEPEPLVGAPFRINTGGSEVQDESGDVWQADQSYGEGNIWGYVPSGQGGAADHDLNVAGADEDEIFSTERWGMDAYRLDVEDGEYDVRLLFAETYGGITGAGQRVFDVTVEGAPVAAALDVYATAGFASAMVREARNVQVADGRLDIEFGSRVENPMIKGIELLPAGSLGEPEPDPDPAVHAADMDGTSIVDSSGTWEAFARVTVANELSQPVLGAVVTVEWEAN
ncbi:MAG: malectin, partial [Dehalococcoidia bacterium]